MKVKTINAIIAKKMKAWWESIENEELRDRVKKETVVTGGCIASMLLREKVRDFDVYLKTEQTVHELTEYYVEQFKKGRKFDEKRPISVDRQNGRVRIVVKSAGVASEGNDSLGYEYFESQAPEEAQAYISDVIGGDADIEELFDVTEEEALEEEDKQFRPVFLSTNAITLSNQIQIVIRFYGTPEEIHENYDFVHCTNYWTKKTGTVLNQPALESLITKELRYVGSLYPVCSIIRTRKFIDRGWRITAGSMLKMIMQSSDLDLHNLNVLEDQLTGVDVAYFQEVISKLKEKDKKKVTTSYLLEILDKMF